MDEIGSIVASMIRTLLEEGAVGVVVILTDSDGAVYSQWAIPKGMNTESIGQVFENIQKTDKIVFH